MKQQNKLRIDSTSTMKNYNDFERESELNAINRILDRRYKVLIQLG